MSEHVILGFDLGTTTMKIAAYDGSNGECLALCSRETRLVTPRRDWVEYEPESYRAALFEALREVVAQVDGGRIEGVSISSQGQTFVQLDADDRPVRNLIVWLDNRAVAEAEELNGAFPAEEIVRNVKKPFNSLAAGSKWLWLSRHEPAGWARTRKILMLPEWVGYLLTGERKVDRENGGSSLCLNAAESRWWPEAVARCGATVDQLGTPVAPGALIGEMLPSVAADCGITGRPKVFAGANDQTAGALGVGNDRVGFTSGMVGTAMALITNLGETPPVRPRFDWGPYAIEGQYFGLTYGKTGATLLTWFRNQFAAGVSYDELAAEAASVVIGAEGLTCIPHFQGVATPSFRADVRGAFLGIALSHGRAHFARAVMEAVCFAALDSLELVKTSGVAPKKVILIGGAAKSAVWMQMMADVLGLEVEIPANTEAATLGVALLAAVGTGLYADLPTAMRNCVKIERRYGPDAGRREAYLAGYRVYREIMERLYPGAL